MEEILQYAFSPSYLFKACSSNTLILLGRAMRRVVIEMCLGDGVIAGTVEADGQKDIRFSVTFGCMN